MTRVFLRDLKPNPFRDLTIDPIADKPELRQSIKDHGFWGGVTLRKTPKGDLEIAAGHTRVKEALACGILSADLHVADYSDDDMVRVYAIENATQRGNDSPAIAGAVAAALRLAVRKVLHPRNTSQPLAQGIGVRQIREILKANNITDFSERSVNSQLSNLKASGDYDRIVKEELTEIERIQAERKAAAEEAARLAALHKAEAEARAEEHRRAVARDEAERVRLAKETLAAEAEIKIAEAARESALEETKTITKIDKNINTLRTASKHEITFDLAGVVKHLSAPYLVDAFRKKVESEGTAKFLAVGGQAAVAEKIVQNFKASGKRGPITTEYVLTEINSMLYPVRAAANAINEAEARATRARISWLAKAQELEAELEKHITGIHSAGYFWAKHYVDANAAPHLFSTANIKSRLTSAKAALDKILTLVSERQDSDTIDGNSENVSRQKALPIQ